MISHKHKCIFIHVPKAAGTSIERVFLDDLGLDMNNRHSLLLGANNNLSLGPRRVSHLSGSDYVNHHYISEELFNSYFKFAFVRNPYSRLFSTYKFLNFGTYMRFDTFVQKKLKDLTNSKSLGFFVKPAYEYLYNAQGELLVDFVGKFEYLEDDFKVVKENLGLTTELKHFNKTEKGKGLKYKLSILRKILKDYRMFDRLTYSNPNYSVDRDSQSIIIDFYRKDFEAFGYDIEP